MSKLKIALDLDNTITASKQSIEFFKILTHLLINEHSIYIITNRELNTEQAIAEELDCFDIEYTEIVITDKKAEYIIKEGIEVFFENSDECFLELPESVVVLKIRECHNFSFAEKKWIGSKKTVKMID